MGGIWFLGSIGMVRSGGRRVPTIFRRCAWSISICDSLRYLFVPLLFTPTPEEANDDHGHIVTAHTTRLRVGGQAVVHHVLTDLVEILLGRDASSDKFDDSLRRLAVPNA